MFLSKTTKKAPEKLLNFSKLLRCYGGSSENDQKSSRKAPEFWRNFDLATALVPSVQVERVVTSLLCPRVPPAAVCLEFLPVHGEGEHLHVARLRVRGGGQHYRVHNLGRVGLGEGAYSRRNPGPDFNTRIL